MHLPSNQPFFLYFSWTSRAPVPSLIHVLAKKIKKKTWKSRHTRQLFIEELLLLISRGSSVRIIPPWEPFPKPSTPWRVITVVERYYFFVARMLAAATGNSMDSTQSNNPASFILFQLPLQMVAGTGRETSHGDVSETGRWLWKKEEKKKKRGTVGYYKPVQYSA